MKTPSQMRTHGRSLISEFTTTTMVGRAPAGCNHGAADPWPRATGEEVFVAVANRDNLNLNLRGKITEYYIKKNTFSHMLDKTLETLSHPYTTTP